jgi:hypothetical protein
MEGRLQPKLKADASEQTNFKNISEAKIYVEWYQEQSRAGILRILSATEGEVRGFTREVDTIPAGELYVDLSLGSSLS